MTRPRQAGGSGAIVIGGDYRALGTVRSLGRRGIQVWVMRDEHAVAASSRYARRVFPWPALDEGGQRDYLLDLCDRHGLDGWAVIPSGDEAAAMLAKHHAALSERYLLMVPSWETMRWAYDKRLTHRLSTECAVDQPWTHSPTSRAELATLDCPFPCIIKPAHKEPALNRLTVDKAWRVENRAELLARYDEACELVSPEIILIQELIPGGGEAQYSYAALCDAGRPIASITARRLRQHPIDFGRASSFVESVDAPEVEALSRKLLMAIGYSGLIEVEYKFDARDGCYKVLDLNPRIWGWHTLGTRAGVDFSYLQWKLLRGEPVAEVRARAGVRWVRMTTDILAAASLVRCGALGPGAYLRSLLPPIEGAIFAVDDPRPGLLDVPLLLNMLGHRARGGSGPSVVAATP
jgi:predicted ATP-grasp superfamily ATP-dependent carboligase